MGGRVDLQNPRELFSPIDQNAVHSSMELRLSSPPALTLNVVIPSSMSKSYDEPTLSQPLVSVVMLCYGHKPYLEEAMRSVALQEYSNWEIIVVDDGSPDNCGELAKTIWERHRWGSAGNQLKVIVQANLGAAASRNAGILASRGTWICCLDGDDALSLDYFSLAVQLLQDDRSCNVIYGNQIYYHEKIQSNAIRGSWNVPPYSPQRVLSEGPFPVPTLFQRSLYDLSAGFNPSMPWGSEDWVFWIELSKHGVIPRKINKVTSHYRYKETSKMRKKQQYPEFRPILRTLFPSLYHPRQLLEDHVEIACTIHDDTVAYIEQRILKNFPTNSAEPYLWLGLHKEGKGFYREAIQDYQLAKELASPSDWQPSFRLVLAYAHKGWMNEFEKEWSHIEKNYPELSRIMILNEDLGGKSKEDKEKNVDVDNKKNVESDDGQQRQPASPAVENETVAVNLRQQRRNEAIAKLQVWLEPICQ
jgi:glycosyltransferase involved in cell wall biosynthesis